jgi:hypothetical protein
VVAQVQDRRMKRAPDEKECKAPLVSRRNNNNSSSSRSAVSCNSSNSNNSNSEAPRLRELSAVKDAANRKADSKDNPNKRHLLQGSSNFWRIKHQRLRNEIPEPFFLLVCELLSLPMRSRGKSLHGDRAAWLQLTATYRCSRLALPRRSLT